ncbi:hypothetical protein CBOM_04162 [Ceraceosorus bombacis]|uniref:Uncharacterized protein n=1 Tax=Ceraceosorus bombacis TaxID=401625 RepID=A0A0P1BN63_9BASI|nr:hypothetical protein CBOM_04162 [Ceraceosorus bombacis]
MGSRAPSLRRASLMRFVIKRSSRGPGGELTNRAASAAGFLYASSTSDGSSLTTSCNFFQASLAA